MCFGEIVEGGGSIESGLLELLGSVGVEVGRADIGY